MGPARKVEEQIRLCVWWECIRRWEHRSREAMAPPTSHGVYRQNSWQKETKICVQAAFDRRHMSPCMDFGSRFSEKKNSRIANLEAALRNPALQTSRTHGTGSRQLASKFVLTHTMFAVAFINEYILMHSQRSPSSTIL